MSKERFNADAYIEAGFTIDETNIEDFKESLVQTVDHLNSQGKSWKLVIERTADEVVKKEDKVAKKEEGKYSREEMVKIAMELKENFSTKFRGSGSDYMQQLNTILSGKTIGLYVPNDKNATKKLKKYILKFIKAGLRVVLKMEQEHNGIEFDIDKFIRGIQYTFVNSTKNTEDITVLESGMSFEIINSGKVKMLEEGQAIENLKEGIWDFKNMEKLVTKNRAYTFAKIAAYKEILTREDKRLFMEVISEA